MTDPRVDPTSEFMRDPNLRTLERMRSGRWYLTGGREVTAAQDAARTLLQEINALGNLDFERSAALFRELLGEGSQVPEWWAPTHVEYGRHTVFGPDCFVNVGLTILDSAPVTIGARTLIGPNCSLITVTHPVNDLEMRQAGWEQASPITIGDDCWFGGNVTVLPGVTIGDRCVLAAGTLVTKDVPADSLVMGSPGRIVRALDDESLPQERDQLDV